MFSRLDTEEFRAAMYQWVDRFVGSLRGKDIAIDGKSLRDSFDRAAQQSPLRTFTVLATETRLLIRQMAVDGKSNEIPAVLKLLESMEIEGVVVALDAIYCQQQTAKSIIKKKGDYTCRLS